MWLIHVVIVFQHIFNACSSAFSFKNFVYRKYFFSLKKIMTSCGILIFYTQDVIIIQPKKLWHPASNYDFLHAGCHNMAQDIIIQKEHFCPTTFQCAFNSDSFIFSFKNFEWWKYPYSLKKIMTSLHIMTSCIILWHLVNKNYDFLDAECHNMDIECHIFFKNKNIFVIQNFKRKGKAAGIKCVWKNSDYVDWLDKMVHFTSDFLHYW